MSDVRCRIVRSDGVVFVVGDNDWRIPNDGLENWAQLTYTVQDSEMAFKDGSIVKSKRVNAQDRSIRAVYTGADQEKARYEAIEFFNPKFSFEAHLTYMGRTRWCSGEQIGFRCSEGNIYQNVSFDWTILCPNPYLISEDIFGKDISEAQARFGFPWVSFLPESEGSVPGANTGAVVSIREFANEVKVDNGGDVPSGIDVVITAKSQLADPSISIQGVAKVTVSGTYGSGSVIEINTIENPPKVTVNGSKAMSKVARSSSITSLKLPPGESMVVFDAAQGREGTSVIMYFYRQFLGV